MITFKQFLNEEIIRGAEQAHALLDRHMKKNPRGWSNKILQGNQFGHMNPIAGGKQKQPIRSLRRRLKHYPDKENKRPTPTSDRVSISSLRPSQPANHEYQVRKYIDHYAAHPDQAKNVTIDTYPGTSGTKDIGNGHHRVAALRLLGYRNINVKHYERT